jgi:hypothetical protein
VPVLLFFLIQLTLTGSTQHGDRVYFYDAQSLALGGISAVLEQGKNPACLGLNDNISVSLSAGFVHANEKRGLRVYDAYGNNMGVSTIANNSYSIPQWTGSSVSVPFKFARIGLKYFPVYDFNYRYYREYRDDFYQIIKTEEYKITGNVFAIVPTFSLTYKYISVGVGERFLYGKRSTDYTIVQQNGTDSLSTEENTYDGTATAFGIIVHPSVHFRFAYTNTLRHTVDSETTGSRFTVPSTHVFGMMLRPPGMIPTALMCEIEYEHRQNPVWKYKVGAEHLLRGRYWMRYGFCVFQDYGQTTIWTTVLTLGAGLQFDHLSCSIGYGYGRRNFSSAHYPSLLPIDEFVLFDESSSNLLVSLVYTF